VTARRALLAWELGGGYGHLVDLRAVARCLRAAGHACAFAVRDLGLAADVLEASLGPVLQAPVRLGQPKNPVPTQVSYSSLLHNIGFEDPHELASRIRAWRDLMRTLRTEILFADHSPIALIAARTLGIPHVALGIGFCLPPQLDPFPSFRPAMQIEPQILKDNDQQVLGELNQALALLKLKPFERLQDIFKDARKALISPAELDHYEDERPEPHLGFPIVAQGAAPEWPPGDGPKVFGYLRPSPVLEPLLEALAASPARALLRVAQVAVPALQRHARPGISIVDHAVDMQKAAQEADVFVSHGPHGAVCEFLLAGKPGLLLPIHQEQVLVTRRAVQTAAAIGLTGSAGVGSALAQLLEDTALRKAAKAFAARNSKVDRAAIVPTLVEQSLADLQRSGTARA
jgi:UDP:flavonoid glycosyltransferase YjiC (YdhE family)